MITGNAETFMGAADLTPVSHDRLCQIFIAEMQAVALKLEGLADDENHAGLCTLHAAFAAVRKVVEEARRYGWPVTAAERLGATAGVLYSDFLGRPLTVAERAAEHLTGPGGRRG